MLLQTALRPATFLLPPIVSSSRRFLGVPWIALIGAGVFLLTRHPDTFRRKPVLPPAEEEDGGMAMYRQDSAFVRIPGER